MDETTRLDPSKYSRCAGESVGHGHEGTDNQQVYSWDLLNSILPRSERHKINFDGLVHRAQGIG